MKPILKILFLTLACATHVLRADDFDLYYLGGQSNMEGFGSSAELSDDERQSVKDAWIFQSTPLPDQQPALGLGNWTPVQPGHGTGFSSDDLTVQRSDRFGVELSFARTLRAQRPDRKIAIVKYARNGSSIDQTIALHWGCWEPDFEAKTGAYRDINQYDHFLATLNNALQVRDIDGDGKEDRLIPAGILWMQGESDAAHNEGVARDYQKNLKRLMDLFRSALRADDLPIAIGRISDSKMGSGSPNWKYSNLVREAQARFCYEDKAAKLVTDTDGYGYSDPWHYDSKGYLQLGARFADAILTMPYRSADSIFEEGRKLVVEAGEGAGGEGHDTATEPIWKY